MGDGAVRCDERLGGLLRRHRRAVAASTSRTAVAMALLAGDNLGALAPFRNAALNVAMGGQQG